MNILVLYRYNKNNSFNHWCNIDFYKEVNNIPNNSLKIYGPNVEQIYGDIMAVKYEKNLTISDIHKIFNFDIIIIAGIHRTFKTYKNQESWLPFDFCTNMYPKILIEPDYHKYRNHIWFKNINVDLILHRHKSNVIRGEEDFPHKRHIWLPFSVDNKIFKPNETNRIKKISFVGNYKSKSYYFRKIACEQLKNNNLLDFNGLQYEKKYIEDLQKYISHLNGSSLFSIDNAKMFEIIASGSILFTNNCQNGIKELFPCSYITYENNFSDLIKQAQIIIENKELREVIIKNGLLLIEKKHTHKKRAEDLVSIINREIKTYISVNNSSDHKQKINIIYNIGDLNAEAIERFKASYESLKLNNDYSIGISDVGRKNSKDIIKEFIPEFKYHYQYNKNFDASIAKNNAFKYLINSNIFIFLDIDMIVPPHFIEQVKLYYEIYKKPFICSYIRLKETNLKTYQDISWNLKQITKKKVIDSGTLVCDKDSYLLLNGFDEEYKEWGGRDSDFYMRLQLINRFFKCSKIVLYHQYHQRQFGVFKEENKIRYNHRKNVCSRNSKVISEIKGLTNNHIKNPIDVLLKNNIDVCLLSETCLNYIISKKITEVLYLGVNDIKRAKLLVSDNVILFNIPDKTKFIQYKSFKIKVPYPVTRYLCKLYGKTWKQLVKENK